MLTRKTFDAQNLLWVHLISLTSSIELTVIGKTGSCSNQLSTTAVLLVAYVTVNYIKSFDGNERFSYSFEFLIGVHFGEYPWNLQPIENMS